MRGDRSDWWPTGRRRGTPIWPKVRADIGSALSAMKISATVEGRPKHYWSIYQKMIVKGRDFDDIHDLVGCGSCDEIRDCYAAVGVVHLLWQPMPGRFRTTRPARFRVYQSLHTTVVGPEGKNHWRCRSAPAICTAPPKVRHRRALEVKEAKGRNGVPHPHASAEIDDMAWMRQLLDWQREAADPGEFLESLRYDLAVQEIFVFTPKGDVITLPAGSTPVDFAYAVHTEVGIAASARGSTAVWWPWSASSKTVKWSRFSPPRRPTQGPSRDWQGFVVSPRAKAKIRQWFAKERREEALEAGKEAIVRVVRRGDSRCSASSTARRSPHWPRNCGMPTCRPSTPPSGGATSQPAMSCSGYWPSSAVPTVPRTNLPNAPRRPPWWCVSAPPRTPAYQFPAHPVCSPNWPGCTPVPGDNIMGFVTRGGGVSVHRTDCTNAEDLRLQSERSSRFCGRRRRHRCSWLPSRWKLSIGTVCYLTSPGCWPTKRSTFCRHPCTPPTIGLLSRFTFEMGDPAPGACAQCGAQCRGCVRRLPGDLRRLTMPGEGRARRRRVAVVPPPDDAGRGTSPKEEGGD